MSERSLALYGALVCALALKAVGETFAPVAFPGAAAVALLALVTLTATGAGRIALRAFGVRDLSESEKTLLGATLGLGGLSQGIFLLAAIGGLKSWAVFLLLALSWVAAGATEMRDALRSLGSNLNLLRERPLPAAAILALLAALLGFCLTPPHQYDSLVYHLPLAEAYVRAGSLVRVDPLLYSHFPQNGEMLYALALILGHDVLAQMFTWLGTFLSVWWVFEMGKREVPTGAVLGACLLVVTHTAVMLLSATTYVECLAMLWVTSATLSFLRWHERAGPEDSPRGWLALAGLFAGLGVGTKYYVGITPGLLALFLLGRCLKSRLARGEERLEWRARLRDFAVFSAVAAAAGAPWLIKNAVTVGNPVFPFLYRLFPPRGVGWTAASARGYFEIMVEYGLHGGNPLWELLRFPWRVASGDLRFGGGADALGTIGWGLQVAAAPAALWGAWRNRYLRLAAAYCAAHWAVWYCTGVVLRFLVVIVPLWSLLCAHGLLRVWERSSTVGRGLLAAGTSALLAVNLGLFLYVHVVTDSLSVLTGNVGRVEYLARKLDYYPCARHARDSLPEDAFVLVAGEQRSYFVGRRTLPTTVMAPNGFVRAANQAEGAADLARRLRAEGLTHVLFVPREAARLTPYGAFPFTPSGGRAWTDFQRESLAPVFEAPGRCGLYRIKG